MDNVTLFPPGGSPPAPSSIVLGSYIMADPGPDYGTKDLIQSIEAMNALRDGGVFAFRHAGVRKMSLPLIINSPYGVNRLPNPGAESATYAPLTGILAGTGSVSAVGPLATGPAAGSYYFVGTAQASSNTALGFMFQFPAAALPTNVPMLLAARWRNFNPTRPAQLGPACILQLMTPAFTNAVTPDSAAPGYFFGCDFTGVLGNGAFVNMNLPATSAWVPIGGILSTNALASVLGAGSALSNLAIALYVFNAGSVAVGSFSAVGLDEIEFRVADRGKAVREWEGQIREYSTPGAYISVQPEGVPSTEAVFFDVVDGRWEPEYNIYENRAQRRKGNLMLDTQPWGYWPTEILLASAASIGYLGQIPVNGASVLGDVPPLAHVVISPTVASVYQANMRVDMLGWSFGGRPSFGAFVSPSWIPSVPSLGAQIAASLIADPFAPASVAMRYLAVASGPAQIPSWVMLADTATFISSALEPAYRGRFRVFALAKSAPSHAYPWQIIVDADRFNPGMYPALASANQLASVYSAVSSSNPVGAVFVASPQYSMYDMGEITLPAYGSGFQQGNRLRLWAAPPATTPLGSQFQLLFAGLYLLPVDGAAGILTRGLFAPSLNAGSQGGLDLNDSFKEAFYIINPGANPSSIALDANSLHRGVPARIGASTTQLTIVTGDRIGGNAVAATYPVSQGNVEYSQVSVSYRPTFQFLYGV